MALISEIIGSFRKYQWWICFIVFITKFGVAFHQMAIIFLAPPVAYYCPGQKKMCCDKPNFNTTVFQRTIITEWRLICEKSWLKDFTQTLFQFGVLTGSLLFGMASDRYGRRVSMLVAVILEVLLGVIASFLPDFWSFSIVRMIVGFAVGGVMVVGFVIIMEYVGNEKRYIVSALYQVPFTLGHIILAAFGYFFRDYMYFQLIISIVNVVLLLYICILPESPRWLLAMNKNEEAIQILENVAKINNMPVDNIRHRIEMDQMERQSSTLKKGTVADLFRTPNIRRNILVMSFAWFTCSYCFYGMAQYITHLTGNIFINVVASGFVCFWSCIISIPVMRYMNRKTSVIVSNAACGICLLIIACFPEGIAAVVFACIGVLFSFIVFVIVYLYCTEMFPTVIRNAALGMSSMMARVGSMIAPFVADMGSYGVWCAPVAFGVFPLIAAALCVILPETKDCELLTTLEEGEALGTKQSRRTNRSEPEEVT